MVKRGHTHSAMQSAPLEQIGNPLSAVLGMPTAIPRWADTDEHTEAVARMEGSSATEIASVTGIPERTVRRIQTELGIGAA